MQRLSHVARNDYLLEGRYLTLELLNTLVSLHQLLLQSLALFGFDAANGAQNTPEALLGLKLTIGILPAAIFVCLAQSTISLCTVMSATVLMMKPRHSARFTIPMAMSAFVTCRVPTCACTFYRKT